jgi:transposase
MQWALVQMNIQFGQCDADVAGAGGQEILRAEHLFPLRRALAAFDFCGEQLQQCDEEIEAQLQRLHITAVELDKGKNRSKARNAPKFDLRSGLFQMCGVDLTRIDGTDPRSGSCRPVIAR